MRIVVTGGTGKAGRHVVAGLRAEGHEVTSVDIVRDDPANGVALAADLTDLGATFEILAHHDAVVHLAAIPAWGIRSEAETWRVNMVSSYNVFTAASTLGIPRVVWASSETVLGFPFTRAAPAYIPMDERSPLRPESSYALSKVLLEESARYVARHSPTTFIGLRLSNIMEIEDYARFPDYWDDPTARSFNLWAYVDVRDVVTAVRLALTAEVQGAPVLSIHAADTVMTRHSEELVQEVFPGSELRAPLLGTCSLVSTALASEMLGWAPAHSWRDEIPERLP